MLRRIRIVMALLLFLAITILFLDVTAGLYHYLGWLPKIQVVPAILSLNVVAILGLLLLTLVFGRIYCSVVCPLGVMQDCVNYIRGRVGKKSSRKNRFHYKKPLTALRIIILVVFALMLIFGLSSIAMLIEPYSEYGRIVSTLLKPLYITTNNALADAAEARDSFMFSHARVVAISVPAIILASATLLIVGLISWFGGRIYCNTICPIGTLLGFLSRFSILRPVIDTSKCIKCRRCERNCKSQCIDIANMKIDYSRCVACMDCISTCHEKGISYTLRRSAPKNVGVDQSKRNFMTVTGLIAGSTLVDALAKSVDGGLTEIVPKSNPGRTVPLAPAGALSLDNLKNHCTSCQLCISTCPNGVLRPSTSLSSFMQPVMSYESGFCRPECVSCSNVCPVGAIRPVTVEEKTAIAIGRAVVNLDACISASAGKSCGNCETKCPAGAITMVDMEGSANQMPVVNESICIGCGRCEYLCPVRPVSAIHVEGYEVHRSI